MALVVKQTKRVEHPSEPGAWFDLNLPLTAGDLELMRDGTKAGMVSIDVVASVLEAWSYDAPASIENIKLLDLDTFTFLQASIQERSGITTDAEKNDSASPSSAPSGPGEADSPKSLGI